MADQDEGTKRRGAFSLQASLPDSSPFSPVCFLGDDLEMGRCFSPGDETGFWEGDSNIVKHSVLSLWC